MRVSWVLLYDWLGYVYFWFSLETWLSYVHSVTTRVLLRIKQLITWVLCIHLPSVILYGFFTFTLGLPIIWRAIRLHLSHPRRTKAKKSVVFTGDHTTPSISFQTLVRSLYHLVLEMFFISMMLCWFLKSVSQKIFSVGQLCDDCQSYAIFTPTSSVLSRIYTRIMS